MRKKIFLVLRMLISAGAVAFVFLALRDRLGEVFDILRHAAWPLVWLSVALLFISIGMITGRLLEIFRAQSINIGYGKLFKLSLIGLFFNNFLPSAVGGDVVKGYYAGKHARKDLESYGAIFTDRAVGYVTLIGWSAVALWVYRGQTLGPGVFQSIVAMIVVAFLLVGFFASRRLSSPYHWIIDKLPSERWRDRLQRLYNSVNFYRDHHRVMLYALLISVMAQFMMILVNWALALALNLEVSLGILILMLPIIAVVQNAPSINGLGIREGAYIFFLGPYISEEGALALSLLFYAVYLSVSLVGGIVYATGGGGVKLKPI